MSSGVRPQPPEPPRRGSRGLRGLVDIRPGRHRPHSIRNGAIFVIVVSLFLFVIFTRPRMPFFPKQGQVVQADLPNGVNVRPGRTPVRVEGVDVGEVMEIEANPDGPSRIKIKVFEGKGVTVKEDAELHLRWRTLLGRNIYVDVVPGSESAPKLSEDEVIPVSRASSQVELDTVLEPMDANGRAAFGTMLDEFDKGFADAEGIKGTARNLGPAMRRLGPGLEGLRGTESGDLTRLITSASRAMGALAREELALGRMVTDGRTALAVTAARRAEVAGMVNRAPAAMRETRRSLVRLETTLDVLDPVADKLRPGARKLDASLASAQRMLDDARPLLRYARPTLADLRPAVGQLQRLSSRGTTAFRGLQPTIDRTQDDYIPWLHERDNEIPLKHFQLIGPATAGASGALSLGDRYGPVAGFEAGFGTQSADAFIPCDLNLFVKFVERRGVDCSKLQHSLGRLVNNKRPREATGLDLLDRALGLGGDTKAGGR